MGCANTKAGGAAVAEEGAPEGGDAQQKDVPKVTVDGDEMAANGNVVNANGTDEGTTEEKDSACNGDVSEKRKSKAEDGDAPSAESKSSNALNGEDAKMADEEDGDEAGNAQPDEEKKDDGEDDAARLED